MDNFFKKKEVDIMNYLAVGIGGMIGSLLRYLVGIETHHIWNTHFPLGTFFANLLGSFVLGWFSARYIQLKRLHPYLLTGIGTGLIGSFTTFSTFSVETVELIQEQEYGTALGYIALSLFGGLFMSWLGYKSSQNAKKPSSASKGEN